MKIFNTQCSSRGQTAVEYVLLLAVVAVVVIASFAKNSLIDQVHNSAQGYYNTVTRVIMDSDGTTNASGVAADLDNPAPINGGWCPINCPAGGSGITAMYAACECPAPAFGGQYCQGSNLVNCTGVVSCSCPQGEVCTAGGLCVSSCQMTCPANSSPDPGCTTCQCNSGTHPVGTACVACPACQTWSGTACVPVVCGSNQTCNPSLPAASECACNQYTYWNGSACVFCQAQNNECTVPTSNGTSCIPTTCATNMYCNVSANACQCDANTSPNPDGTGCLPNTCAAQPAHSTICPKDPSPTGINTTDVLVNASTNCGSSTACEYYCSTGYELSANGTSCVSTSCAAFTHTFTGPDPYEASKNVTTTVTFSTTTDGNSASESCGGPTNSNVAGKKVCWEGDPIDSCSYGTWGTINGACTPETCTGECTSSKTADTPLCTVTFPADTGEGTDMTEYCPSNCTGGPLTDTCSGGAWGTPSGPSCLENCATKTVGTGTCAVTLPAGTTSGTTPSESCPSGCTGGPVTSKCTNGAWGTVSGSCLEDCSAKTVGTGTCAVTLPAGTTSGTTPSESCPSGCTGGPVASKCTNGAWGTVSGSCLEDCSAKTIGTGACAVTMPDGTTSGSSDTEACPSGCSGGPVTSKCTNGVWGTASGSCLAQCPAATAGTGACEVVFPEGTDSGTTVSEACPSGCSVGGPVREKCNNGVWTLVSGSCRT